MTPGILSPKAFDIPHIQTPLFLLGSDSLSKDWLIKHQQTLMGVGAIGLLVQAEDFNDVAAIRALGKGLMIFPASADDLAEQLNLHYYPVLISKSGVEQ